ncbi:MAG: usg protein [Bauldia sp.]
MKSDFNASAIAGYGLTTAEILYRMPDHRDLLQSFIWQHYDVAPDFPTLNRFLAFWREKIEGPLHSVSISHHKLLTPAECRLAAAQFALN